MHKLFFLSLAFWFIGSYSYAQAPLVQYMENVSYFNPAAVAYQPCDSFRITTFYRNQWLGLNGNPQDIGAIAEYNLSKINSGIGVNFSHERIGFNKVFDIGLAYRYSLKFKNDRVLSAGVSVNYYHLRTEGLLYGPQSSFYLDASDATISSRIGVFYSSRKLLLGLSVFHPTQPELRLEPSFLTYKLTRVFNFHGSYNFHVNRSNALRPELVLFANSSLFFTLINLKWIRNDKVFIGAGMKNLPGVSVNYSANVSFGYDLFNKLYMGAAYEYFFRPSGWSNPHSIEFMVRYAVRKKGECRKISLGNPSF